MKLYTDNEFKLMPELLELINFEHENQIKKWGVQTHTLFEWCNYTTEELGEVAKAISENEYRDGDIDEIIKESIQVATLSLKIAEMCMNTKLP